MPERRTTTGRRQRTDESQPISLYGIVTQYCKSVHEDELDKHSLFSQYSQYSDDSIYSSSVSASSNASYHSDYTPSVSSKHAQSAAPAESRRHHDHDHDHDHGQGHDHGHSHSHHHPESTHHDTPVDGTATPLPDSAEDELAREMSETTLNAQDRPLLDQCAKCEQDVLVQAEAYLITEFDAVFHISCFVCEMCGSSFSQASPFVPWNGRPYCQGCHAMYMTPKSDAVTVGADMEAPLHDAASDTSSAPVVADEPPAILSKMHSVCAACHEPIRFNDPEGPELMALGKHWHARHLACCICGDVMIRDLANGRARPVPHLEYEGRVYCQTDFPTTPQPQCARCGEGVSADSVAAIGKVWHRRCFTCVDCDCAFPSKTFYVSDGQPTCRRDFHIHNGSICGTCDEPIEGPCAHIPDLKARFHPECFCCVECSKPLESTYFKYKGMPYCEMDMRRLYKSRKYARYEGGGQAD